MPVTRTIRRLGGSVALTIPRDFAKAMGLSVGDVVEVVPMDPETLSLRKAPRSTKVAPEPKVK